MATLHHFTLTPPSPSRERDMNPRNARSEASATARPSLCEVSQASRCERPAIEGST